MAHGRRPDIDWLRIIATYLLFVFHVGMVFNPAPFFHVRNTEQSAVFLVLCGFIGLWHMPLFFLLAGWSAASSLRVRGVRAFFSERVRRLLIPLVAGCLLLAPVIKYLELRSGLDLNHLGLRVAAVHQPGFAAIIPGGLPLADPFDEDFGTFLPTFFTLDRFTWAHLWFVAYLFVLTTAYAPMLAWLVRRSPRSGSSAAWLVYAPAVALVAIQLTLRARWPGIYNLYDDWANIAYYSTFLLAGALLACDPALERLVDREWTRALAIGTAASLVLLLGVLGVLASPVVLLAGTAVAGWCFVVALLGMARRYLTATSPTLEYLSESAFPVYVLHQVAIVVPGYLLVGLALGIATKFALLLLLSVASTMAVYHWGVRPFGVPRFLLGMKLPRPAGRRATATAVRAAIVLIVGATSAGAATPEGLWHAEGGAARILIERCGETPCGRVVWLRSPLDDEGCEPSDAHNPSPGLRARPVVGIELLRGVSAEPRDGAWSGGTIHDPTSGRTYSCERTLDADGPLQMRGYLGAASAEFRSSAPSRVTASSCFGRPSAPTRPPSARSPTQSCPTSVLIATDASDIDESLDRPAPTRACTTQSTHASLHEGRCSSILSSDSLL